MAVTFRLARSARMCAVVAVAALPLTACAAGYQAETSREKATLTSVAGAIGPLTLRNIFLVGPAESGGSIPLYMAIFNGGQTDDKLVSVSSDVATGGYVPADSDIAPLGSRYFNDGDGDVPQLTGLTREVRVGQTVNVKMVFRNAGELDVTVTVLGKEPGPDGSPLPTPSAVPSASASDSATPTPAASGSASATPSAEASATP